MTLRDIIRTLADAGVDSSEYDALLLVERFCGLSRAAALADRDRELTEPALCDAVARRAAREPLQYILGRWEFRNEEYEVSPACLIPRPETELLTEHVIAACPAGGRLLDLCCGSGCVAISALAARPDCTGLALELFDETLALAVRNAARCGVADRLTLRRADVTDPAAPRALSGTFDVISSNPPYIPTGELSSLAPELAFEPSAALDGGEDGLRFYRALLSLWLSLLAPGGVMLLELGAGQGEAVTALARAAGCECLLFPDLAGHDRVAEIRPVPDDKTHGV